MVVACGSVWLSSFTYSWCLYAHEIAFNCSTKLMTEHGYSISKYIDAFEIRLWLLNRTNDERSRMNMKSHFILAASFCALSAEWSLSNKVGCHCLFHRITYYSCNSFTIGSLWILLASYIFAVLVHSMKRNECHSCILYRWARRSSTKCCVCADWYIRRARSMLFGVCSECLCAIANSMHWAT